MKKVNITIALFVLIGIIFIVYLNNQTQEIQELNDVQEIPSKCYSILQPSNYFETKDLLNNVREKQLEIDYTRELFLEKIMPTHSMIPSIPDNSHIIYYIPTNESEINIGDVVWIKLRVPRYSNGYQLSYVVHRIISKPKDGITNETLFITKGDNVNHSDEEYWKFSEIKGKVVGVLY